MPTSSVFLLLLAAALVYLSFHSEECEIYAHPDRTVADEAPPSSAVERFAARKTDPKAVPALDKVRPAPLDHRRDHE